MEWILQSKCTRQGAELLKRHIQHVKDFEGHSAEVIDRYRENIEERRRALKKDIGGPWVILQVRSKETVLNWLGQVGIRI